jgi:putative flavoprotein involved in K+ transport
MNAITRGGDEMSTKHEPEYVETLIIGGGQAGLAAGYHLAKRALPFLIVDANDRVGDAWRKRWDSLHLFTPACFDGLPGLPFPAPAWSFPSKDEMADYLEQYAAHFELPVRTGTKVRGLGRERGRFVVTAGDRRLEADNVIVASGAHQTPKLPAFAGELDPRIVQLHSRDYLRPAQLQEGDVLVVGAGNSGAEIALELSREHRVLLAGPSTGQIPVRHGSVPARFAFRVVRFLGHNVFRVDTRIGRKVGPKLTSKGDPLIRTKSKDLAAAGVERVPRVVGLRDGLPELEDGQVPDVANVVWCTGFKTEFPWVDLPVFADDGQPLHYRGVVDAEPGLYFTALVFLYSISSDVLPGIGRDAEYTAEHIAARRRKQSVEGEAELLVA